MAILNMDYYIPSDDDVYSDGSIESAIYKRVKENQMEVGSGDEWAEVYHLSPLRHNILNWYPFRAGCSILEIGAGCGALTGLLAERAAKLVSVELTKIRANIAFERNRDRHNLEVIVGDINRLKFTEKFDYIICNGVLEYAGLMIRGNEQNPGFELLSLMRSWLKEDGILLLAIENRLGLKYFAGSKEDHVGKAYAGIDGYRETRSIRTYSREELKTLCEKVGLVYQKWFFPFPDYKFPMEIFTDCSVNDRLPGVRDVPLDTDQVHVFDEERVYTDLMEVRAMQSLSNSFLIEASASELPAASQNIDYVELKYQCKPELSCRRIWQFREKNLIVIEGNELRPNKENVTIRIPDGCSFFRTLQIGIYQQGVVQELLEELRDQLYALNAAPDLRSFRELFGIALDSEQMHWISGTWLDLDAWNLYSDCRGWNLLATQSPVAFPIPAELALWRMVQGLRTDYRLANILTNEYVCAWLGISTSIMNLCTKWNVVFEQAILEKKVLHGRKMEQLDVEIRGRQLIQAKQDRAVILNLARQSHDELYALAELKSYRIAYSLYRFFEPHTKGLYGFLKRIWKRFRKDNASETEANPILQIADSLM